MKTCPWTGKPFQPLTKGGNEKVFATTEARQQAHLAARLFTEHQIKSGFLTWETVRQWYDGREKAPPPSNTLAPEGTAKVPASPPQNRPRPYSA